MGKNAWIILSAVELICMVAVVAVSLAMGGCNATVETAAGGQVPMKCHWAFVATPWIATGSAMSWPTPT